MGILDSNNCPDCLKPYWDKGKTTVKAQVCQCHEPKGMIGWTCPRCGAGLSPSTSICPCKAPEFKMTYDWIEHPKIEVTFMKYPSASQE